MKEKTNKQQMSGKRCTNDDIARTTLSKLKQTSERVGKGGWDSDFKSPYATVVH